MYKVYCNDVLIHDGSSPSREIHLINPSLKLGDNIAGSLDFVIPPTHIAYNMCALMQDTIIVKQDGKTIWKGRPINASKDFWNNRKVTCEGALAFLNDTTQDLNFYEDYDPARFLQLLLNVHNSKVGADRGIRYGHVTVTDDNTDYVYETNYKSTYAEFKENLLDRIGGHIKIWYRESDGIPFLDYLQDYEDEAEQEINFGHNLMDFTRNWDLSHLCTTILPKGAEIKKEPAATTGSTGTTGATGETGSTGEVEEEYEQKEYITIAPVNGGDKYLINREAYQIYGRIERTVEFSDCETPQLLLELAIAYITAMQFDDMTLEVSAIDLHFLDPEITGFQLLDQVRCISLPHGMDRTFPITAIDIALDHPENTKYTLNGSGSSMSMSSSNISTASSVDKALRKTTSTHNIISSSLEKVNAILTDYAHITDGIIDNAEIGYANVRDLETNYARIEEGVITNATINYANVNELYNHYAQIDNGVISNATIDSANITDLNNRFAHIENGEIDNAKIRVADVKDLEANYAKIENGYITNATITSAKVDDLDNRFAHISYGVIDNAEINYAKVKELDSHYSKSDFSNVTNSWVERGVIKDGAITSAMILGLSANKITSGTIDASQITVTNLNADNITAGTINGQRLGEGTIALSKLEEDVYTKSEINGFMDDVNDRLDSAIETYTGTAIPLLNNYPASDWTSNDVKDTHVGDVYYLVNPNLPENGYAYRFSKLNNAYSWELISDSDVTAALNDLKSVKDRVSTIESFDTDISTWKTSVDGNISTLTSSHTTLSTAVGKTVESMTQLWYTKDDTTLPPTPSTHVTSESVGPKEWTTAIPIFDNENPHYFYCWEYKYKDGTYSVSDPVYDRVMSQSQMESYGGIIASYQLWTIGPTEDVPAGPTGIGGPYSIAKLLDRDSLLDSNNVPIQDNTGEDYTVNVASQETIDFLKRGNLEYMHDSNGAIINDNVSDSYLTGLRWTIEVPVYDVNNPNYFYCWEYHYLDGTVDWSDGVFDKATTQAQKTSQDTGEELNRKVDITTFNKLQHTTDMNSAEITRIASVVTNNEQTTTQTINNITQTATATTNTIKRITQRLKLNEDGSAGEEDIVHEYSELSNAVDEFKQVVGRTYYTKEEAANFKIGGRNLLRLTRAFESTSISDEFGESIYDSSGRNITTSRSQNGYLNNAESLLTFDQHMNLSVRTINLLSASSNTYSVFAEYSNVIVPETETDYIFSFYAKGSGKFKVYFTNGSLSEVYDTTNSQSPDVTVETRDGESEILVNGLWSRYWVKWTMTSTATRASRNVEIRVYGGNQIYICGVKFEESSKATDWTPAPEDGEEMIESTTREFDKVVEERVGQVETAIIKTAESIELKADKNETYTVSDINGIIEETITSQSSLISQTAEDITTAVSKTYATKTELGGLSETVGDMSTAIQQNAENIALKANSSTTYTKTEVNNLITTEVRNRNSAIEIGNSGVLTTVSNTYATKTDFRNLGIGGRNYLMFTKEFTDTMLTDSDGKNITDSRGVAFGVEEDRYLVTAHSGLIPADSPAEYNSYKFQDFGVRDLMLIGSEGYTDRYEEFALYKNVIAPIPGQSYVFSFYAKGSGEIVAYFYPNPTGGTCAAVSSQDVESNRADGRIVFTLESSWTRYWVKWTIGGTNDNNAKRNVLLRMFYGLPKNQAYVCALKFEEGTVPTAWSPAIEDAGVTLEEYQEALLEELRKNGELINEKLIGVGESVVEAKSTFHVEADNIKSEVSKKTDKATIISTINQSPEEIKISADRITLEGTTTFSSFARTSDIPTKLSQLSNEETNYQTAQQISNAIAAGTTTFAKKDTAIQSSSVLYYATNGNQPSKPTGTTPITDATGNTDRWTIVRPALTNLITKMFICTQRVTADGKASWSNVVRDNTTTNFSTTYQTVAEVQTIYYANNVDSAPAVPATSSSGWVTRNTKTGAYWTKARPDHISGFPYVYSAVQTKFASGTNSTTTPIKDTLEDVFSPKNDTVADTQYVYKSAARGVITMNRPSGWITATKTDSGEDIQGDWTTIRPKLHKDYPNLFISKQVKTLNGNVDSTLPIKDESLTVIDGGYISTGEIDASKVRINNLTVESIGGTDAYMTLSDVENNLASLKKYVGVVQAELITNGTFSTTELNGWTADSGTFAMEMTQDGYLHLSTTSSSRKGFRQDISVDEVNKKYYVTVEVKDSFHVGVGTSTSGLPSESAFDNIGKGKYRFAVTSTSSKVIRIYIFAYASTATNNGDTYIKNISVIKDTEYSGTLPIAEQIIYINIFTGSGGFYVAPSKPSIWITNQSSTSSGQWTNIKPEYNPDYRITFLAKQTKYLDGTVTTTDPIRDTSMTVIDGGSITTGKVSADHIDVSNIVVTDLKGSDDLLTKDGIGDVTSALGLYDESSNLIKDGIFTSTNLSNYWIVGNNTKLSYSNGELVLGSTSTTKPTEQTERISQQLWGLKDNTTYALIVKGSYHPRGNVDANQYMHTPYVMDFESLGNETYRVLYNSGYSSGVVVNIAPRWYTSGCSEFRLKSVGFYEVPSTASSVSATEQYIYYSASFGSGVNAPTTWVTDNTGNQNAWTTIRPIYSRDTPWVYKAKQSRFLNGSVECTTPAVDQTTTIIDGANILTRSVKANAIEANTITANEIAAKTITANEIAANAITADKIAANAITASKISGDILEGKIISGDQIEGGTIKGMTMTGAKIEADSFSNTYGNRSMKIHQGRVYFADVTRDTYVSGMSVSGSNYSYSTSGIQISVEDSRGNFGTLNISPLGVDFSTNRGMSIGIYENKAFISNNRGTFYFDGLN